jgi:glycosyltransferase involved in cell wall biosynthesis
MKLNLFTPLPPARTDIAQCVARFLPALAAKAEVTLWTEAEADRSLAAYATIRRFNPNEIDWRDLSYADCNLYNVGNDARFHASIMDVAFKAPGVVILHDVNINELAYHTLARHAFHKEQYLRLMTREGPEAAQMAVDSFDGKIGLREIAAKYPLSWWALQGACGVVTHNRPALDAALPWLRLPVLDTPLPWTPRAAMRPPIRRELKNRLEMVICGHLNSPNRRLTEVLEAMASFPQRERIFLHVAGHIAEPQPVEERVHALGLDACVRFHGFMGDADLEKLLDSCHMAVNLRWPSMGEASGAQTRFWNHSLPTLVTRTAWYGRQRSDCVLFVEPECERESLHRHWASALADYPAVEQTGLNGRRYLEERHSAEVFTDAILAFLPLVAEYRKTAFVPKLAERAGQAIGGMALTPEAARILAKTVGAAIGSMAGLKGDLS